MKKLFLLLVFLPLTTLAQVDSLDLKIGQMILIGMDNIKRLDTGAPIMKEIREGKVGGIIMYEKHIDPARPVESMQKITAHVQKIAPIPLFIGIDEEGGRVNRLKPKYGFPKTVSAAYLGRINRLDSTYYYANRTAKTLKNLGINMNFAPDVDVNVNTANPVIGKLGRSYSTDPDKVILHAREFVRAHQAEGIICVPKHFPGHGSSASDTHLSMADVSASWQEKELLPFIDLMRGETKVAIMTAHIVNGKLDASKTPATLSKAIITGLLRDSLRFEGVVMSDDMQMHAISKHFGFEEAIVMCVNAGVDVLMFANNTELADKTSASKVHAIIKRNVLSGKIPRERIEASYRRIMRLKQQAGL
jgi:beta-N-acetylhexosaminidase